MKLSRGRTEGLACLSPLSIVNGSLIFAVFSILLLNNLNRGEGNKSVTFGVEDVVKASSLRSTDNDLEEIKRLAYIPITAYNSCNDRIKHLSCMKTVVTNSVKDIVLLPELSNAFCDLLLEEKNIVEAENEYVDVCLQVGNTEAVVCAVVRLTELEVYPFSEISALLRETEVEELLPSVDTSGDFRVIDRKVVITTTGSVYAPRSKENNMMRDKDANTGNMIWSFGVRGLINPFTTVFDRRTFSRDIVSPDENLDKFGVAPSVYVIGTANLFDLNSQQGGSDNYVNAIREKVEDFSLPTVMLGAGVQFDFTEMPIESIVDLLHDSHKQLLQTLEDNKMGPYSVSVRGNVTETACKNAGFSHCIALGCPSLTINRSPNLGYELYLKWETTLKRLMRGEKIKIGVALPASGEKKETNEYNRQLISSFEKIYRSKHDVYFIKQTEEDRKIASQIVSDNSHAISFDNAEDWREFTGGLDVIISSRIHGGMSGIMAGTPVVIIPTDMRIMELVNAMTLPTLSLEKFLGLDPEDILTMLQLADPDFEAFESNRREKISKYKEMLNDFGLELDPQLLAVLYQQA